MSIQTSRFTLRAWGKQDIDVLPTIANDRRIWLNVRDVFPHPYERANAEAWIALCEQGAMPHSFAIEIDGQVAGGIGLHAFEDVHRNTAELGYWLGAAYWGRGYATEAVRAIVQHGFDHVGFERIQASVFEWNEASSRVLVKAGFDYEGRMRRHCLKDGRFGDVLLYARVREVGA
jgi:ribosomal-protein-alanine N-acetyltransferase